ncbi:RagB/SusD family nutrient uptake outer membrane protein [Sunxiuqinia sp. A32]|uniref:RagB/SusD family nutrient uptake outer membrane protein n=1 Tax=Sunxiuqinia sp. A32 TaxID=3461496 RepID=UPI00404670CC
MKLKNIIILVLVVFFASCTKFLEEEPKTFLTPSQYYVTESQMQAAVNGTYDGLSYMLSTDLEIASVRIFPLEFIVGHCTQPRSTGSDHNQFLLLSGINDTNGLLNTMWRATFMPLENCNSVIENLENSEGVITETLKKQLLGEVYFLRAYYYFLGVQLFGDIPLKTTPTKSLSNVEIPKSPKEDIYNQIVQDLLEAEKSGLPWTAKSGHVSMGTIKTLLTKVYLTMAGYPLRKGNEYYQKAYDTAKEVIASNEFYLFDNYEDLRKAENENLGEHMFMIQRTSTNSPNPFHFGMMPYPEAPISINPNYGGGIAPLSVFYESYDNGDLRTENGAYFYTSHAKYGDESVIVDLGMPYINKYWDDLAEETGQSGANIPIYRYADVLLMCAEAKASLDGGTTTDQTAIDAYYQVRHRALPNESKPSSINADDVIKERFWELCFEFQNWFDMLRTHKAFDPVTKQVVDLIGYTAPNHEYPFKESDLIFPVPYDEKNLNPLLRD